MRSDGTLPPDLDLLREAHHHLNGMGVGAYENITMAAIVPSSPGLLDAAYRPAPVDDLQRIVGWTSV
jgi:hypothetical protein